MALTRYNQPRTVTGPIRPREIGSSSNTGTGTTSTTRTGTTSPSAFPSGSTLTTGPYAGGQLGPGVTADAAGNLYVNGNRVQFTTGGQQGQIVGSQEAAAIRARGGQVTPATDVLTPSGQMAVEQYNVTYDPQSVRVPFSTTPSTSGEDDAHSEYYRSRIEAAQAGLDPTNLPSTYDLTGLPNPYAMSLTGGGESAATRAARQGAINQGTYLLSLMSQTPTQYSGLREGLGSVFAPARTSAETSYQTALQALQGRRGEAETLAGQGQAALGAYLAANQPRAYANLPQAQAPELQPDVVARYAAAIGVPTTAIGQAAAQAAVEAQAAGGGYNRLLDTLRAAEASGQASRLAELEMLKNVQGAGIQQLYGAGAQQLEATRQAALNQIAQQQAAQEFALRQAELSRQQALQQALLGVYGTGYVNPLNFGG